MNDDTGYPTECACGTDPSEDDGQGCIYFQLGYPLCPKCGEHHRWWPECPSNKGE